MRKPKQQTNRKKKADQRCLRPNEALVLAFTKTYVYNFDLLKPHFYIVKLGFTGVYIIFLISAQKYRFWVLVRTIYVLSRMMKKYQNFYMKTFSFLVVKFSTYLNRRGFRNPDYRHAHDYLGISHMHSAALCLMRINTRYLTKMYTNVKRTFSKFL